MPDTGVFRGDIDPDIAIDLLTIDFVLQVNCFEDDFLASLHDVLELGIATFHCRFLQHILVERDSRNSSLLLLDVIIYGIVEIVPS